MEVALFLVAARRLIVVIRLEETKRLWSNRLVGKVNVDVWTWNGMRSSISGQDPLTGCCEHRNERAVSFKAHKFIQYLCDCQFLKALSVMEYLVLVRPVSKACLCTTKRHN